MGDKVIPVKVAVRCRPLIQKEQKDGCQCCLQFVSGEPQLVVGKDKAFTFDYVFGPDTDQLTVYQESVLPLVKGLFKGYNATVLAYGQTGSGKTYSMGGGYGVSLDSDEEMVGIIPRVIRDLFAGIKDLEQKYQFVIRVSYLELYKDDLFDLFVPPAKREKDQVQILNDNVGVKLTGMSELEVKSFEETMKCLEEGSHSRTVGATAMNNQSSRSHAIFTVHLDRKSISDSQDFCKAKFHLVDLAGSERIKKTHAEGERLKEGININKGLLVLGNVISALGEDTSKRGHIPYRNSKLTRLLQDSLGGNSHTLMMACVSPADSNMEETINTLRYADRARKIKNKPVVNRDPQIAEVIRLRQLVQELQSQGLNVGGVRNEPCIDGGGYEKIRKLEEEKLQLVNELQASVIQNTELMEKIFKSEMAMDCLKEKLHEIKETTKLGINQLLDTTKLKEDQGCDVTQMENQLNLVKQVQEKLLQIETEVDEKASEQNNDEEESVDEPSEAHEEMRSKHVLKQAQMSRELKELNLRLTKTQELASQMENNSKEILEMREKHEQQMKEMEGEIEKFQKERDELVAQMQNVRSVNNNNKVAEQRRKRIQDLEGQIQQLRKKLTEQMRMLKMKEQSDKQVEKLNQEIMSMKQHRVRLMNQIKDDAEQFRKMKAEMAKEVLQLKSQDRKRLAEMAKLQRQHQNQQAVLKRKAEEAAAANNKLKEVLMRQRIVADDRNKKQENADVTSVGSRVRKLVNDEMELLVTVEEARTQLNEQMNSRKEMNQQILQIRTTLEDCEKENMSEEEIQAIKNQIKDIEQQMVLCNLQISDLQQKLLDADQDEKAKSRWENIHTMMEAKCAIKWLLTTAVSARVDADKKERQINDLKAQWNVLTQSMQKTEEELSAVRRECQQEKFEMQKENESKVLYLLNQIKNPVDLSSKDETERVKGLQKRIAFQEEEITKFARFEEELLKKTEECEALKKEFTKVQYKKTTGLSGSLMPSSAEGTCSESVSADVSKSEFFSSAVRPSQKRKRTTLLNQAKEASEESSDSEDPDDLDNDPTWKSGLTPAPPKAKSRFNRNEPLNQTYVADPPNTTNNNTESQEPRETRKRVSDKSKRKTIQRAKDSSPNEDSEPITSKLDARQYYSDLGIGNKKRRLQSAQQSSYFSDATGL